MKPPAVPLPGAGAAARLGLPAAALSNVPGLSGVVANNSSMVPERVVRRRVVPGMDSGVKASKQSLTGLEQTRALVAQLKAEALGKKAAQHPAPSRATAGSTAVAGRGAASLRLAMSG
jgi:hypothetical protein